MGARRVPPRDSAIGGELSRTAMQKLPPVAGPRMAISATGPEATACRLRGRAGGPATISCTGTVAAAGRRAGPRPRGVRTRPTSASRTFGTRFAGTSQCLPARGAAPAVNAATSTVSHRNVFNIGWCLQQPARRTLKPRRRRAHYGATAAREGHSLSARGTGGSCTRAGVRRQACVRSTSRASGGWSHAAHRLKARVRTDLRSFEQGGASACRSIMPRGGPAIIRACRSRGAMLMNARAPTRDGANSCA
jgi:hypothetical protein